MEIVEKLAKSLSEVLNQVVSINERLEKLENKPAEKPEEPKVTDEDISEMIKNMNI